MIRLNDGIKGIIARLTPDVSTLDEFKTWLRTSSAPSGEYICRLYFNAGSRCAIVTKYTNNSVSFIIYGPNAIPEWHSFDSLSSNTWISRQL